MSVWKGKTGGMSYWGLSLRSEGQRWEGTYRSSCNGGVEALCWGDTVPSDPPVPAQVVAPRTGASVLVIM